VWERERESESENMLDGELQEPAVGASHLPCVEFFIGNLLVRVHFIIDKILVNRPCAMGV
jgi:hypothetical protein